jgi:hypothetical protein
MSTPFGGLGRGSMPIALVATALVVGAGVAAMQQRPATAAQYVDCGDARWTVGMNIPDRRDVPAGEIVRVDAIRRIPEEAKPNPNSIVRPRQTIGYLYTLKDGRTYVADRGRADLTIDSLAIMNDVVNGMSKFSGNAFDPRDGGSTVYKVTWSAGAAKRLGLETAPCPVTKMK